MVEVINELNVVLAAAERVWQVLEAKPSVTDASAGAEGATWSPVIEVDSVTFAYPGTDKPAISELTFTVAAGETVALVGHSGAGKTTTTHLLLRYWDPQEGAIRLGGRDLREVPLETLRTWITVVPQDVYLFNQSLARNIAIANPDSAPETIWRAAEMGGVDQFVAALPDGLETTVGERGAQLSGGQRQRVAFARATLKDAPILILDEPVSNLDTESEQALVTTLREWGEQRTVVVVAHRLSTVLTADRIIVLEDGRVVEMGTHHELVTSGGVYAKLMDSQLLRTG